MFSFEGTYLNSAYIGPQPQRARNSVESMMAKLANPSTIQSSDFTHGPDVVRDQLARLLNVKSESIALSTSVSELVSHVANGLALQPSDEVLLLDGDYPSMVLPWMLAAEIRGVLVRRLPLEVFQSPARLKGELTSRTKLVGASHILFSLGHRLPISDLAHITREHGALFLCDVTQSFAAERLSPSLIEFVDILVGAAYKWQLGPYGAAFGHFNSRALSWVARTHAHWLASPSSRDFGRLLNYSTATLPGACRFDRGQAPAFLTLAAWSGALDLLQETGLGFIERHNQSLAQHFNQNLPSRWQVVNQESQPCSIVCLRNSAADAVELQARLAQKKIFVSVREGNLRISFHFFNNLAEVYRLLCAL